MNHAVLLMFILTEVLSCSIKVCLRWTIESDTLKLICKTDDLHLYVIFKNNYGNEIARCTIPNPVPECRDNYSNITSAQYPEKNETIVKVNGTIDQRINGKWSCHHGVYNDFVEINMSETKGLLVDLHEDLHKEYDLLIPLILTSSVVVLVLVLAIGYLLRKCGEREVCERFCFKKPDVLNNVPSTEIELEPLGADISSTCSTEEIPIISGSQPQISRDVNVVNEDTKIEHETPLKMEV